MRKRGAKLKSGVVQAFVEIAKAEVADVFAATGTSPSISI